VIVSYSMRRMELRAPVIIIWPFLATVKVEHRKSHLPHLFSFSLLWYDTYLPPAPQRSGVENKIGINSKYAIQCKYTIVERVGGVALVLPTSVRRPFCRDAKMCTGTHISSFFGSRVPT
jgi:hypothetical protein